MDMLLDDPPQRRPSVARDRPSRTPFGPRRPKNVPDMPPDQPSPVCCQADAAVQVPSTPSPPPYQQTESPTRSAPATFIAPPPLTPPPPISFEPTPIPWKGLPLEAAQWTFSSAELQEIVSKAIRLSARDSFVRLLSLQALEIDIVHESERLEAARLAAQARWRFEAGRRTMLMQALNAALAFSATDQGGTANIPGFVGQLASAIASCDSLLSTILQISDQQSQIALIQHQHWASALGIALRKLNKAHERQGQELQRAQARVNTLEDELEEAWREAEKMAIEFDDLEHEIAESESEQTSEPVDDEEAAIQNTCLPEYDLDETGTLADVTIHTDIAVVLGVTATAVASKATLIASSPKAIDKSDTKSIKSTRSRRDGQTRVSRISSARKRSRAASNASLRLPKTLRSSSSTHPSQVDTPPMPIPQTPTTQDHSFLDMDNARHEHVRKASLPKRHPEPTLALPSPPNSAGLPLTRVPSIWIESDGGKSTRLNGLDRAHSLQIFSSLAPRRIRRSNLVMSLTGNGSSDGGIQSRSPSTSSAENLCIGVGVGEGEDRPDPRAPSPSLASSTYSPVLDRPGTGAGSASSPTSTRSPVSLPTHALTYARRPSLVSMQTPVQAQRPGSAGARLTTAREGSDTRVPHSIGSTRRSLVSRASSVILRRLSQATVGSVKGAAGAGAGAGATGGGAKSGGSPSKSREGRLNGGRAFVERWKDRGKEGERERDVPRHGESHGEDEDESYGEVMLIGSPHADVFDAP